MPSPNPGSAGNSLYGVAAIGPHNVWAVGQCVGSDDPDQALIVHWDGIHWSVVGSPRQGTASAALYGVGGSEDRVWAVGGTVDQRHGGRALVEILVDDAWRNVAAPRINSPWATLWRVSASDEGAWTVGSAFNAAKGDSTCWSCAVETM